MAFYLIPFAVAAALSLLITPIARRFAISRGIVDSPGGRRIHKIPTARLGGVAIFISFWLALTLVIVFFNSAAVQNLSDISANVIGVLAGAIILVCLGIYDDVVGVRPAWKLFWHFVAAFMPVLFGVKIWWLNHPFGGPNIVLGDWTYLVVPVWIVLVINVVNWLDGLDGLASGVSAIAAVILFFLSLAPFVNQPGTALLAIILAGTALGFLPYNFNPAKIFLGDSGSQFLGYMLAIFAIISGAKVATAALVLGVPILDALWVISRRILSGKSPFVADRKHLHHRFIDAGLSQKTTVLIYWVISISVGLFALRTQTQGKLTAALWLLIVMVLVATIVIRKNQVSNSK